MLLSKCVAGFSLSKSADGLSPNTLGIYGWALNKLTTYLGDPPIEDITSDDLRRWFSYLRTDYTNQSLSRKSDRLTPGSLQNAWVAVKSLWHWTHDELGIKNIADAIKRPEGDAPIIKPFTEDECRAMLKVAEAITTKATDKRKAYTQKRPTASRNIALILVLLDTGLRATELCRLKVCDVDLKTGEVTSPCAQRLVQGVRSSRLVFGRRLERDGCG